ncbi:transposase (fragment) [Bradyrhizobium sp. STM 3843]
MFHRLFERVVVACIRADLVGGSGFAVDASLIAADAKKCRSTPGDKWDHELDPATENRAVQDYLASLDDPAWGAATEVVPKFVAPADPAAQWTGALRNAAFFAYADNYLIDVKFGIIMDVEASRAIRQAEVGASQTMIERTEATFGIKPDWLVADTAYGSAPNLHFLVDVKGIAPHVPVIDKSKRDDGTFSRDDFIYDDDHDCYVCPNGKIVPRSTRKRKTRGDDMVSYFSRVADCRSCPLKSKCCPKTPSRKITRHIHEAARDVARAIAKTAAYEQTRRDRKKVEMLFAHLKRILRMGRLRLRRPAGAQFEFTLAAIAQNLRRLAKLTIHPPDTSRLRVA